MTTKELAKDLKEHIGCGIEVPLYDEELEVVVEALEKQIAKEPEVWANGTKHCPCCEKDITNLYFKVCIECGQRLEGEEPVYIDDYVER